MVSITPSLRSPGPPRATRCIASVEDMTADTATGTDAHGQSANFLILGGAGDLVRRLLIPGIAAYLEEYADRDTRIRLIGAGRTEVEDYPQLVRDSIADAGLGISDTVVDQLADNAGFVVTDATSAEDLRTLIHARDSQARTFLYFALAPGITASVVDALAELELPEEMVLVMEKPFGKDAATATELNEKLLAVTDEAHIFRVDHFNFETALSNLTGLVGANALFAAGWHNREIESVEIVYEESLALEGRAEFFDSNGALRDMLQSHLLQTMAHALSIASTDSATDILAATSIEPDSVRRARYTAGEIDGEKVPAYVDEEGVDPDRDTETLFQVTAEVDTDRWRGVPVTLRSGKAIGDPHQAIKVTYRRRGHDDELEINPGTVLSFPFTDEVAVEINVSDHGYSPNLQRVRLQTELVPARLTPYGRLVRAILVGDHSMEVPADAARRAWEIVEPVLTAFAAGTVDLAEYPAGSRGPADW